MALKHIGVAYAYKIRDKIKKEIKPLAQNMLEKKISNNHLKWMAKTLEQSVK